MVILENLHSSLLRTNSIFFQKSVTHSSIVLLSSFSSLNILTPISLCAPVLTGRRGRAKSNIFISFEHWLSHYYSHYNRGSKCVVCSVFRSVEFIIMSNSLRVICWRRTTINFTRLYRCQIVNDVAK